MEGPDDIETYSTVMVPTMPCISWGMQIRLKVPGAVEGHRIPHRLLRIHRNVDVEVVHGEGVELALGGENEGDRITRLEAHFGR